MISNVSDQLKNPKLQDKIKKVEHDFSLSICNDLPTAFWNRKKHIVTLPYEEDFSEKNIPTRPVRVR